MYNQLPQNGLFHVSTIHIHNKIKSNAPQETAFVCGKNKLGGVIGIKEKLRKALVIFLFKRHNILTALNTQFTDSLK